MKYIFGFLLIIHGIIHLIGFAKSFFFADINKQVLGIPKPIGAIWLLVFILFMVSASAFFTNKRWFYIAFIAAIISQILIVFVWKEAKFGTIANVIILVVSIAAYGNYKFKTLIVEENEALLRSIKIEKTHLIAEKDISHLPEIIRKWMINSGVIGKEKVVSVRLKQQGQMKLKPKSNWLPFKAEQYFNVEKPSFIWSTEVNLLPSLNMIGRDKFMNGEGEMLIKLEGLIPLADEGNNEKINAAAMIRYLAELTWFPSAALNEYIHWEAIDELTSKATFTLHGTSVSGIFSFSNQGDMISFETKRYFGAGKDATLETWFVKTAGHKFFDGYKIPSKCEVFWKLNEGDFNWLNFEITELDYNQLQLF